MHFYVPEIKCINENGLHLISTPFMPWAFELLHFIASGYTMENVVSNKTEYIAVNLQKLKANTTIFDTFKQILASLGLEANEKSINAIHLRIALYTFRSYTNYKHGALFNQEKKSADDKSRVDFRTGILTGIGRDNNVSSNNQMGSQ